jgi:hypothetical protein
MATLATAPGTYREAPDADAFLPRSVWRAPLVPAALAVTAGIVLDRYAPLPLLAGLAAAAVFLAAWCCTRAGGGTGLPLVYLALAGAAFGAAYHHYRRTWHPTTSPASPPRNRTPSRFAASSTRSRFAPRPRRPTRCAP